MSNDVSGTSTSVECSQDAYAQEDSATERDSNNDTPAARVPVEVVVHGADEPETDEIATEELATDGISLSMDPAEEVAFLLGETKPVVAKAKADEPTAVEVTAVEVTAVEVTAVEVTAVEVLPTEPVAEEKVIAEVIAEVVAEEAQPVSSIKAENDSVAVASTGNVDAESKKTKSKKLKPVKQAVKPIAQATEESDDPVEAPATNAFEEMGLSPGVLKAIDKAGYDTPSPIQSETVPYILAGRDLMGQAETGSGKTAAFAWPLLSKIDIKLAKPQVLVLAPTRELAIQVTAAFEKYASGLSGFRAVTIYGGQSYETQLRALSRGVQVVVGTPGRVMDHLRRKTLDLRSLKTLVLDEADEMLRMGFIDDVEWILEQMPEQRQILSFSATLPAPIQRIAQKYLQSPANVAIKSKTATADSIEQSCVFLHAREKLERLVRILETEETDGVLVFVKTRNSTMLVTENLIQKGIIASALNGDIPQNQRERTVNQLKSGRINVVVATDVAARGLDVSRISHVINYDFPHDTEAYVHRIGRTGRAGRTGNAILFVEPKEKGKLSRLQHATNQRIEKFQQKSIDQINQLRIEKFKQQIVAATENDQLKFFSNLVSELQTETDIPSNDLAGALAVLAQGDSPLLLKELKAGNSNWKKDGDSRGGGRTERGPMTTYRVEVGRSHGVGPGNIVGAVTNEANLNNGDIGRINIFDRFSTIDLPSDIPQDLIEHLKNVQVSGERLAISKSDQSYAKSGGRKSGPSHGGGRYEKGPRSGGKKFGDKKFAGKKFDGSSRGGSSYGKSNGDKSYGDKPKWSKPSGDKPKWEKPAGEKSSWSKPAGEKPKWEKPSADQADKKPYIKKAFDKPAGNSNYSEKKPFVKRDKPSGDSNYSDRKPDKRKSNAGNDRTERGDKQDRYAREGVSPYAGKPRTSGSGSYAKSKPKSKTPKTKTAIRTQANRKPGAKPSSPMKKYVKIRSSK